MKIQKFKRKALSAAVLASVLYCTPAFALQTGGIKGNISTDNAGISVTGVTVTVTSNVMPKARSVVTSANGTYRLPLLIPGMYEVTITTAEGVQETSTVEVLLDQTSSVNFTLESSSDDNVITIMGSSTIITEGNSSLTNSLGQDDIENLPVGQDYRDLLKLIPGVQYTENSVLGPSAGGSGRDNKYGFDGVDVSLPMFGNLASEPSTHDIQSVSMDLGGAKAVGFNRSGGFAIDTISKSGTNEFHGNIEYKLQDKSWVADKDDIDGTAETIDRNWLTASLSGPIIEDELFFYGSFYRPEANKVNKETAYGPAKDFESIREEYYGKFTYAPTDDLLFNLSYRTSDREDNGLSVGAFDANSTSQGSVANQDILTFEGSYIIGPFTTLSFMYSEFTLESRSGPDTLLSSLNPALGDSLNLSALDSLGQFFVPDIQADNANYDNIVAQMLIDQYGYIADGSSTGGGTVGAYSTLNDQNFYRDSFEIALDHEMDMGATSHKMHFGFKWAEGTEVLSRLSNGWGDIFYIGGQETASDGTPIYYQTITQQMSLQDASGAAVPAITSSSETFNFEFNDTIEQGDFIYNVGVLISNDILYGQGLKEDSSALSGFVDSPGTKYKMHEVDFKDMIQPRLGITWAYNGEDTVFANFAKYNPEASSLARAASWARNTRAALDVDFDINGNFIESEPRAGSSGKFFQDNIKPRQINELTIGTTKMITDELYLRAHMRRREGSHFWEDTWNSTRSVYGEYGPFGGVPADIAARGDYIPDLNDWRNQIGGGSSYVIAELDGGYTSYNEFNIEAEYQGDRTYLKASYTWNHYYGNFDQDSVSGANDANLFIGSSNLADGRGRQLWDGKTGKLLGDRPHLLKVYGYYTTDWEANLGFYLLYQSGDVWEAWDGSLYGYSSSTIRNAEVAGSRRGPSHWQLDLNYTQDFELTENFTMKFRADVFNLFDNQTGYSLNPYVSSTTFGEARRQYNPRRLQLSVNIGF